MSLAQEVAEAFLEPAAPAALAVVLFSTVCALCTEPKLRSGQSEVPIREANVYRNASWQAFSESLKAKKMGVALSVSQRCPLPKALW